MYGLLTKLVRSRWLDIGQVLYLRVFLLDGCREIFLAGHGG